MLTYFQGRRGVYVFDTREYFHRGLEPINLWDIMPGFSKSFIAEGSAFRNMYCASLLENKVQEHIYYIVVCLSILSPM